MTAGWYWLSWATEDAFHGGAYVPGRTLIEAVENSFIMRISPGSHTQVAGLPVPPDNLPPLGWRGRLLSKPEIEQMDLEVA